MKRRPRTQAGFTLIELMIALVMFSFAVAGVLAVAVSLVNGYREQRAVIGAESTVRSGLEIMGEALRGASPGVPSGAIRTVDSATCSSNLAFSVINSTSAPDEMTLVYAYGSVVTSSRTAYIVGTTQITVVDDSQISVGDTLLITDFATGHLVQVTGKPSAGVLNLAAQTCSTATMALPAGGYGAGSLVIRALRARFYIGTLDGVPTLFMDPDAGGSQAAEPLAEGVEDMQIAFGVDATTNGLTEVGTVANDDEWQGNVSGDMALAGSIRAVRITLTARALSPVSGTAGYVQPAAEDRAAGTATDNFRRRLLTSTIEVRNLGGSP